MHKGTKKPHPRSSAPKYPGITDQAKALGCTRQHLFAVLSGKRTSARLMARYLKLNKAAA